MRYSIVSNLRRRLSWRVISMAVALILSYVGYYIHKNGLNTYESMGEDDFGLPIVKDSTDIEIIKKKAFTIGYNKKTRTPSYVIWLLKGENTNGDIKREDYQFSEDPDIEPLYRVTTADYIGKGYDRGHICPAGDLRWNSTAMEESFLMSNICPQNAYLNQNSWNELEIKTREWAKKYGEVYVVAGPIYTDSPHKKIGKHRVQVPEGFYKIILRLKPRPTVIAFAFPNTSADFKFIERAVTMKDIEQATGIIFFPKLSEREEISLRNATSGWIKADMKIDNLIKEGKKLLK